ncbi:hypothetical protein CYY_000844 [Polysphondylium violaceum]|uniref:OTU domain-containing protein n=1 Tax=Polysphondylium violaceum TaxID=133409 RepID=A0A8J4V8J6_9MYCE|nr:hypothetical protein CYY_000844 [Polysphondylium violaceum]
MTTLEDIDKQLRSLGLCRKEVPKDGSCLFRCVSESLFGTQNYHDRVRKQCIKYLKLNRDMFEPFACIHNPWEKYIQEMEKEGTWGGEVELQALSLIYEVNFIIYIGNSNTTRVENAFKKNILLAYCHGEHYDLVFNDRHMKHIHEFQSFVYDMVNECLGLPPSCGWVKPQFKNISLKLWESQDKVKQIRDNAIAEKLLKVQTVNKLDEYQSKQRNRNSNNNNKQKKQQTKTKDATTPPPEPQQEQQQVVEEYVDPELQEILRQIEQQELEEQRLLGLEKHFPTFNVPQQQQQQTNKVEKPQSGTVWAKQTSWTQVLEEQKNQQLLAEQALAEQKKKEEEEKLKETEEAKEDAPIQFRVSYRNNNHNNNNNRNNKRRGKNNANNNNNKGNSSNNNNNNNNNSSNNNNVGNDNNTNTTT